METNTRIRTNKWLCSYTRLKDIFLRALKNEIAIRVCRIKDLTPGKIPKQTNDEIIEMKKP